MSEEPFLLVSLEEEKAKTLALVLSNDTARKILDLLSKKDHSTETDIAKELKLPISTVHYNMSLLVKSDLVSDETFNYSEKGKKVVHYSLSNKYVIIAPKKSDALKERLRQFLPVVFITAGVTAFLKYGLVPIKNIFTPPSPNLLMAKSADMAEESALSIAMEAQSVAVNSQELALWFLFGSVFALVVYFVWAEIILKKIKK